MMKDFFHIVEQNERSTNPFAIVNEIQDFFSGSLRPTNKEEELQNVIMNQLARYEPSYKIGELLDYHLKYFVNNKGEKQEFLFYIEDYILEYMGNEVIKRRIKKWLEANE